MPQQPPPQTASSHYAASALIAQRAVKEAAKARPRGLVAIMRALNTHQVAQAVISERYVAQALVEQEIEVEAEALLNSLAFTTEVRAFEAMTAESDKAEFDRIVESLVQDAGRAAESVAVAVRPDIYHVRYVSPPCCARCAVLAGRVYRYSEGFPRHTNCDCVMIPTTVAAPFAQDPEQLVRDGLVRNLSKADTRAVLDGADLGQVVNVRRKAAGLQQPGRVLARLDRLTPEAIYRTAGDDRDAAVQLLKQFGYVT